MENQINNLVNKLYAGKQADVAISCDTTSSAVHLVQAPISEDLYQQLQTMSVVYKKDANCLGGELLIIALQELLDALPAEEHELLHSVRAHAEQQYISRHMEELRYDAGAT